MSQFTEATLGSAVALLILKEVFAFLRLRRNGNGGGDGVSGLISLLERLRKEYLLPIRRQQQDLHEWHNVTDAEGVKLWYGRSLHEPILKLQDAINEQNEILRDIARSSRDTLTEVRRLMG